MFVLSEFTFLFTSYNVEYRVWDRKDKQYIFFISELSAINLSIPVQNGRDKATGASARSLVDSFDSMIQEFCTSFAKFLCTYSTRVKLYEQLSEVKQKVSSVSNIFS